MPCDLSVFDDVKVATAVDLEKIIIGPGRLFGKLRSSDATILTELGLYNRDGLTFTPDYSNREILADQFRSPLRTFVHTVKMDFNVKLLFTDPLNMLYAFMSPDYVADVTTGTVTSLCVTGGFAEEYWHFEFVVPFVWDTNNYDREIIIPKAAMKDLGDLTYKSEEEAVLDMTFSCNLDFDVSGFSTTGLLFGVRDVLETP